MVSIARKERGAKFALNPFGLCRSESFRLLPRRSVLRQPGKQKSPPEGAGSFKIGGLENLTGNSGLRCLVGFLALGHLGFG